MKIYISFLFWKTKWTNEQTFNIVHFPNFEISASLELALPSYKHHT